ncbi:hypothetical protein JKA74_12305 [Marivirga sp. S37H4]|uniref:Peptidase E n=1 Tax=Marivirga aurantiaca TaxID=2802615 RepID=A0A934WZM6_9BACT|nr:DUF6702 family protein [Marivirga aurantiaca]MBK6265817.1 hypothetical protein [Marivirga aurantiaca]
MIFSNYIIGLILVFSGLHPFHVSITELIYKEEAKSVQVMHKVFIDDFEQTLNKNYKVNLDILAMDDTQSIDSLIEDYLKNNFSVEIDGKEREVVYLGSELEENVLWCYQEIYKVKSPKIFEIRNSIMFDEFDDQSNLVHTTLDGKIKTIRLVKGKKTQKVKFQ